MQLVLIPHHQRIPSPADDARMYCEYITMPDAHPYVESFSKKINKYPEIKIMDEHL